MSNAGTSLTQVCPGVCFIPHHMSVKEVALHEPEGRREESSRITFTTQRGNKNCTTQGGEGKRSQPLHPKHEGTWKRNGVTMAMFVNHATIDTERGVKCERPVIGMKGNRENNVTTIDCTVGTQRKR